MTAPAPSRWLVLRVRVIDRLAALVLAPVIGPIAAVLAWKVVREDGRPALVGLPRVGEDGRTFKMWKLRTMRVGDASGAAGGAVINAGDDDRVTPFGRTLRRWRLDELPQLINVIRGDMGLLGPRPETPSLVALDDERWQAVLAVRPGGGTPVLHLAFEVLQGYDSTAITAIATAVGIGAFLRNTNFGRLLHHVLTRERIG